MILDRVKRVVALAFLFARIAAMVSTAAWAVGLDHGSLRQHVEMTSFHILGGIFIPCFPIFGFGGLTPDVTALNL